MKIQFLGAAREVGRSCILLDNSFMLDCGIKISENGQEYPAMSEELSNIKAVLLSHGHLDHCGALPYFNFHGLNGKIYCTSMTKEIAKILLQDSIHIEMLSNKEPAYSRDNIKNVMSLMIETRYHRPFKVAGATVEFFDAGHIQGSSSIVVQTNNKKVLYTGDINSQTTNLIEGLNYDIDNVDIMITETTYGNRDHPDRQEAEDEFLETVQSIIKQKGKVLLPCFSVGRAQELMLILGKKKWKVPLYMDGMAKKITNLSLEHPESVRNYNKLKSALEGVKYIKSDNERDEVVKKPCIIVTTSGMMVGGPILEYLKQVYNDPKTGIILTGYQASGSNGRLLLDEQKVVVDGMQVNVKCSVHQYDFSAHCGRKELVALIKKINPKHLVLNHGDVEAMESIKKEFAKKMKVYMPKASEIIEIP